MGDIHSRGNKDVIIKCKNQKKKVVTYSFVCTSPIDEFDIFTCDEMNEFKLLHVEMWTCGLEGLSDIARLNTMITVVPGSSSRRYDPAALMSELGDACRCRSWNIVINVTPAPPFYLFETTAKTTSERAVVAEWVKRNTFTQETGVFKLHCSSIFTQTSQMLLSSS